MFQNDTSRHVAAILNAAWMVRHYQRGSRSGIGRLRRQQAVLKLGLTVREALNSSEDYEALLAAIVEGLRPKEGESAF